MSIDFALQPDSNPTDRRNVLGSLFIPDNLGKNDIDWLRGILDGGDVKEEETRHAEPWIYVAPDFYVKKSEYQRRFGEIDLEFYRRQMPPELFAAFVRHMGVVPGSPGLDVVELTTLPDL
jgi:hypothetical protein